MMAFLPGMGLNGRVNAMRYVLLAALLFLPLEAGASAPPDWQAQLVTELVWMERALLEASYFSALAVMAPTVVDQRILAQRVVNILEGRGGPHFDPRLAEEEELPGVLPRLQALALALAEEDPPPPERETLRFTFANVNAFLTLARELALRGASTHHLLRGAISLRQAYACLLAALGPEDEEFAYLGGIRSLLARYRPLAEPPTSP